MAIQFATFGTKLQMVSSILPRLFSLLKMAVKFLSKDEQFNENIIFDKYALGESRQEKEQSLILLADKIIECIQVIHFEPFSFLPRQENVETTKQKYKPISVLLDILNHRFLPSTKLNCILLICRLLHDEHEKINVPKFSDIIYEIHESYQLEKKRSEFLSSTPVAANVTKNDSDVQSFFYPVEKLSNLEKNICEIYVLHSGLKWRSPPPPPQEKFFYFGI